MAVLANGYTHNLAGLVGFFKFYAAFLFIPFKYSAKKGEFKPRSHYLVHYWLIVGPVLTALHTIASFIVVLKAVARFTSWHSSCGDVKTLVGLTLANLLLQTNACVTAHGISIARNYDEVLHLCNAIVRYRIHLKGLGAALPKDVRVLKPLIVFYGISIYSNVALCLHQPEKPLFLYWLIPTHCKTAAVHNAYMLMNTIYACTYWATLFFTLIVIILFVSTSTACLQFWCKNSRAKFHQVKKSYFELLVLLRIFENAFGRLALPAYVSTGTAILTFANYGVVRFFGRIGIKLYVSFWAPFVGVHWVFACLLRPGAFMRQESQRLRRNMRTVMAGEGRYGRVVLRSLPDIDLRVGNMFSIDRTTHIAVLGFVAINAMTLLITV